MANGGAENWREKSALLNLADEAAIVYEYDLNRHIDTPDLRKLSTP
jgi:hypothetical protein